MPAPSLFQSAEERQLAGALSRLAYCNPFLPERIERERDVLGTDYVPSSAVWGKHGDIEREDANVERTVHRARELTKRLRARLAERAAAASSLLASTEDLELYEDVALYWLFNLYQGRFRDLILAWVPRKRGSTAQRIAFYADFVRDWDHCFSGIGGALRGVRGEKRDRSAPATVIPSADAAHVFACFFQIRRAFYHIFENILGESMAAARLRASVWQSIFTHDMRRYRRSLYARMADFTCLITGPSGTGKELVARAIGYSRYIPFDPDKEAFTEDFFGSFFALSLSALSPTLIESELFGHQRGSFTGALKDRAGWLEVCPPLGTVFLDEIGELDAAIQVKLLRLLQTRTFQRIGDTEDRFFHGKIIAATHRDLAAEIRAGRTREDFFYRLCSDRIETPSLDEQIRESEATLATLVQHLSRRLVGEAEADSVAREVLAWIAGHLPKDYSWPGNVRELEQCVRNIVIRGAYLPLAGGGGGDARRDFAEAIAAGRLTMDDLMARYCTLLYAETGNYQEAGRRLGVDPRTVKAKLDEDWLAALRRG